YEPHKPLLIPAYSLRRVECFWEKRRMRWMRRRRNLLNEKEKERRWRSGGGWGGREREQLWEIGERKWKTAVLEVEHLGVN
ncbi:MAG: hypothetical protein ACKESB_03150, partial [Candidatus Hodgkinia cicadicola]